MCLCFVTCDLDIVTCCLQNIALQKRYNTTRHHHAPCRSMSCHASSCHIMSMSMSCHVMSCHVMSCHVMWCAVLSSLCYVLGVFRFTLHIPDAYPDVGPRVLFAPNSVFNPLVNYQTGELDLTIQFPVCRAQQSTTQHTAHTPRTHIHTLLPHLYASDDVCVVCFVCFCV